MVNDLDFLFQLHNIYFSSDKIYALIFKKMKLIIMMNGMNN